MGFIPKLAVEAFLKRPRDDCRPWREFADGRLDAEVAALPVTPPIWRRLRRHQKVGFLLGVAYLRFGFWYDTGTGKSLMAIALARYFRAADIARRHLVLVPNRVNRSEWAREIARHAPSTSYRILTGSSAEKWAALEDGRAATLTIATYQGLVRMVTRPGRSTRGKPRLEFDLDLVDRLAGHVDGLVLDESNAVGDRTSLQHRLCHRLGKTSATVFALSGTPFGADPTPLWGQMRLIDGGASLGETLGLFRASFFNATQNVWGGFEYSFRTRMQDQLHRLLAHRSLWVPADAADLPSVVHIVKEARLPADAASYHELWRRKLIEARGNHTEINSAFIRIRQISSGFLGYTDDDTGARAQFAFDPNPKLELLTSLLQTLSAKAIVFNEFIFSGDLIAAELGRLGIAHARVYGGTKHPEQEIARFVRDPACRVLLLANAQSYGINAQVAKYAIFYESPVSPVIRKQAVRRVERQGSAHRRVFIYDLVTRGTLDQQILAHLAQGRDLFKAIVEGEAVP